MKIMLFFCPTQFQTKKINNDIQQKIQEILIIKRLCLVDLSNQIQAPCPFWVNSCKDK